MSSAVRCLKVTKLLLPYSLYLSIYVYVLYTFSLCLISRHSSYLYFPHSYIFSFSDLKQVKVNVYVLYTFSLCLILRHSSYLYFPHSHIFSFSDLKQLKVNGPSLPISQLACLWYKYVTIFSSKNGTEMAPLSRAVKYRLFWRLRSTLCNDVILF